METILSIADSQDSGACVFENSELVYAVNEERLNREKLTRKFPHLSIETCLNKTKYPDNLKLVVASYMTPNFVLRFLNKWHTKRMKQLSQFNYTLNLYIVYQSLLNKLGLSKLEKYLSKKVLEKNISIKLKNLPSKLNIIEHHTCHAYSAYSYSSFNDALVVTMDGMGDGLAVTVNIGKNGKIKRIYAETGLSAETLYYSKITEFLGFKPLKHEGKIMGLAAHGDPRKTEPIMKKKFYYKGKGKFNKVNYLIPDSKYYGIFKRLKKYKKEDVAAGVQKNLENEVAKFIEYWLKKTGLKKICLAGGLFANVKLNQKIHELKNVESIFIFPHMSDGGIAIGAILACLKPKPSKLKTIYFGEEYNKNETERILKKSKLRYTKQRNIEKKIAQILANGNVVARFSGRMEFGPRALGNRSILYRPNDKTVMDWLNKKLKRTEFMPFAPAVLAEDATKCFKNIKGAEYTAKFMNITFNCTEWMKKNCPGVVHVDGTARPQLVEKKDNPEFYKILKEYKKLTGLPCIINTSFNMHEEPIVCTPQDAVKAFKESKLNYLAIENCIIKQE